MHDDVARPEAEQRRQQRDELLGADRREDRRSAPSGSAAGTPRRRAYQSTMPSRRSAVPERLRVGVARRSRPRARRATTARRRVDRRADRQVDDAVRGARAARARVRRDGSPRGSRAVGDGQSARPGDGRGHGRLRRQGGDDRVVLVDHADLGGAAGRAHVVEELDVGVVVVLPLVRAGRPRSRSPRPGTPARRRRSRRTRPGGCRASGRPRRCSPPGTRRCTRGP